MTLILLIIAVFVGAAALSLYARRVDDRQKRSAIFAASGLLLIGAMVTLVVMLFRYHIV